MCSDLVQAAHRGGWGMRPKRQVSALDASPAAWPYTVELTPCRSTPASSPSCSAHSFRPEPPVALSLLPTWLLIPPSHIMIYLPPSSVTPDTHSLIFCFPCKAVLPPLDK